MRLLLDTHVLLALLDGEVGSLGRKVEKAVTDGDNDLWASIASLWELAIKSRLGKLPLPVSRQRLPAALDALRISVLEITADHVLRDLVPEPSTRDPFDRLLLAQCDVEGLHLLTIDRSLVGHPLAWRA